MGISGVYRRFHTFLIAVVAGALGIVLGLVFGAVPAHAAGAVNKTILSGNVGKTFSKTISKYDVTGDGAADKLSIKKSSGNGKYYEWKLFIRVNGKRVGTIGTVHDSYASATITYLRTKNKKPFMFIKMVGVNSDGPYGVYKYRNGKLVKLLTPTSEIAAKYCGAHKYIESVRVKGKKVIVCYGSLTCTMAYARYSYTYLYKSGKLRRTSAKASSLQSYQNTDIENLNFSFRTKLYKHAGSKSVKCVAPANAQVTIVGLKCVSKRPWFKVKLASGKTGWIKGLTREQAKKIYTQVNYKYDSLFKQIHMAG